MATESWGLKGTTSTDLVNAGPVPTYVAPTYTPPPEYTAPTYDEGKIETLTQRKAAGGLRSLRNQLQRVTGGSFENPNVRRMTLREALAGYGTGIENIMSGANTEAERSYQNEYGRLADTSKIKHQGLLDTAHTQYQGALASAQSTLSSQMAEWTARHNDLMTQYTANMKNSSGSSGGGVSGVKWDTSGNSGGSSSWNPSSDQYDSWVNSLKGSGDTGAKNVSVNSIASAYKNILQQSGLAIGGYGTPTSSNYSSYFNEVDSNGNII